jgi:hypothetical protein
LISKPLISKPVLLWTAALQGTDGKSADRKEDDRETASGQANVARLRDQAAMVNETHALDAHEFHAYCRPEWPAVARRTKPEIVHLAHAP